MVNLTSGKLTVRANNSSLSEILHEISKTSGMKVEGLQTSGGGQRIFGIYGPGAPRDVLSELLDGAGYNVLMLGVTSSGAPRELALTVRSNGTAAPTAQPQPDNANQNDDSEGDAEPTQYPDENQQNVAPPPALPEGRRTPQQMLEELQRQRQQQQEQQQDQQPN